MQPIIKDIILSISDDVVSNLTQSFEKTYYGKMNYSSKNTILDSDNKLLKETIGFEIAFIHVITYFLAYSMSCSHEYMHILNILDEAYSQLVSFLSKCTNLISDVRRKAYLAEQEEIQKLADEKKKIDSQFENLKELYKEDDFVKQIGKLSSNDEEVSAQKIDELLETYIAHTEKKKQGIEKIQNDYNRHYSETQKAYQAKIDFQESELNLYKNLASLGMLTGSFGHETSDIVSRIQRELKTVWYLKSIIWILR